MIWLGAILVAVIAAPIVVEMRRRTMDDVARGAATGQFVHLSQGVTHYDVFGPARGPVIVMIHGLTTPSFVWRGMTKALALSGYRVLIYDLYGRGFSSKAKGVQNRAFFLQQLTELLAHEGVQDDVTVVGYSMGGALATCFAASYPDRVSQLVLLAPAGMRKLSGGMLGFTKNVRGIGDWLMLAFYPRILRKGIQAERGLPSSVPNIGDLQEAELAYRGFVPAVLSSLRGLLARPLEEEHKTLMDRNIRVLAIWGRHDSVIPLSAIGTLAEWNRNAQHEIVEGAGHGLTYTHSDEVLRVMRGWMADNTHAAD